MAHLRVAAGALFDFFSDRSSRIVGFDRAVSSNSCLRMTIATLVRPRQSFFLVRWTAPAVLARRTNHSWRSVHLGSHAGRYFGIPRRALLSVATPRKQQIGFWVARVVSTLADWSLAFDEPGAGGVPQRQGPGIIRRFPTGPGGKQHFHRAQSGHETPARCDTGGRAVVRFFVECS